MAGERAFHGKKGRVEAGANPGGLQTILLVNTTGGTFTLTFGGNTTAAIAWNATAADVQAALVALASIGAGKVVVAGPTGGQWYVAFMGTLRNATAATITASATNLTGATPSISITPYGTGISRLTMNDWSATDTSDRADVTGFESGGSVRLAGIPELKISCKGFWNPAQNYMADPPGIYNRDDGPPFLCYLTTLAGYNLTYFLPISDISNVQTGAKMKEGVPFSFDLMSQGSYVRPDGSVVSG